MRNHYERPGRITGMNYNSDFKYDLAVGQEFENELAKALTNSTIEVKRDFKAMSTGNIFVEYESRQKPSGIATSEAEYYCWWLDDDRCVLIKTNKLKQKCRPYLKTNRDVLGGDNNTSKGILLPLQELTRE